MHKLSLNPANVWLAWFFFNTKMIFLNTPYKPLIFKHSAFDRNETDLGLPLLLAVIDSRADPGKSVDLWFLLLNKLPQNLVA